MIAGLTIAITSVFMIILGNNIFAIEYSKYTINKYGIEFSYLDMVYLDSMNHSFKDNNMVIPVTAEFKNSNQAKLTNCANGFLSVMPNTLRYEFRTLYWDEIIFGCAYGFYYYKLNIGQMQRDDPNRDTISINAVQCAYNEECLKKINKVIKGKIALPQSSTPSYKPSTPTYPEPTERSIQKQSPEEEEKQVIDLCVQNLNAERLPQRCHDLTPELKEKVKNEAQKLGVSAHKLDDYKNITITQPQLNQDEEEQPWEIGFCAKRVYYSNHLPPFCEDQWKEKIDIEVQKLKEKDPAGGFKGDLTKKDNKDDDSTKDNDDEGDDDDKKKND